MLSIRRRALVRRSNIVACAWSGSRIWSSESCLPMQLQGARRSSSAGCRTVRGVRGGWEERRQRQRRRLYCFSTQYDGPTLRLFQCYLRVHPSCRTDTGGQGTTSAICIQMPTSISGKCGIRSIGMEISELEPEFPQARAAPILKLLHLKYVTHRKAQNHFLSSSCFGINSSRAICRRRKHSFP